MKENVGRLDRKVRMGAGALLVLLGAAGYAGFLPLANSFLPQALTSVLVVLAGIILLATGYTRKCALYSALGINTEE